MLQFDKAALIESGEVARTRDLQVGFYDDEAGLTAVWGALQAADAAVLDKKVAAMAATVCDDDPRSVKERRADALGALADGNNHLACACSQPELPGRVKPSPAPKSSVVIHVLTDQTAEQSAILSGTEVMPTPVASRTVRNGAKLRPLRPPG